MLTTGIIDLSAYLSRLGEFEDTHASGFMRFISPFWMTAEYFDTTSLPGLLRGNGPGTAEGFVASAFYKPNGSTWFKLLYEYGLIGAFIFICFLGSCFRRSRCPKPLIAALIYYFVFTGGLLLSSELLIIMVVLCTLSGPEAGESRSDRATGYRPFAAVPTSNRLVAGSLLGKQRRPAGLDHTSA